MINARIERPRVVRPIQIESLAADLKRDSDVVIFSHNTPGEECAGNGGSAN
jgi:hypothetical protein